jgi:trimeric autotransporter adhesin
LKQLRKYLTVANLLSCIALFVALGGAAYAAGTLTKKSVKAQHLANGSVTTPKLRNGAVTNPKLRNGAVSGSKIAPAAIDSSKLANGSVRSGQLGGGVVTEAKIKNGAVGSAKLSSTLLAQLVKNVTYVSLTSGENTEQTKSVTATCPTGKQAIGGGVRLNGELANVAVTGSTPFFNGSARTGWSGFAHETGGGPYTDWSIEAFAVCAEL